MTFEKIELKVYANQHEPDCFSPGNSFVLSSRIINEFDKFI